MEWQGRIEIRCRPADVPMASYLPWYGKKRARLAECERTFLSLFHKGTDPKRLRQAAETVRLAQGRALKARRAQFPPSEKAAVAIANLDREIQFWQNLTADQVIEGYRSGSLCKRRRSATQIN